jgi:[ribosomal protein S18]-alanine N-acetyltransferase
MLLRISTGHDLAELARLHAACFSAAWSEQDFAALLQSNLILLLGEPAIAFIVLSIVQTDAEVITLGVHPQRRQAKVATKFLSQTLEHIAKLGVSRTTLEVADDNRAAIALYRRAGFLEVGRRKRYYQRADGPAKDALVLALNSSAANSNFR